MIKTKEIDIDYVRKRYRYDANTGVLTSVKTGKPITNIQGGYYQVRVHGVKITAHRVIWAIHYGIDPGESLIDHINRNPLDNRIDNLRLVDSQTNLLNNSGLGVTKIGKRWLARWQMGGELHKLGWYDCPLLGGLAVLEDKRSYGIVC